MNLGFYKKFIIILTLLIVANFTFAYSYWYYEDFETATTGQMPSDWSDTSGFFAVNTIEDSNRAELLSTATPTVYAAALYDGTLDGSNPASSLGSFALRATVTSQFWTTTGSWFGLIGRVQADGSAYGVRLQGRGTQTGAWLETFRIDSSGNVYMMSRGGTAFDGALKPNSLTEIRLNIENDDLNQQIIITGRCRDNDGAGSVSRFQQVTIPYGDANDIGRAGTFGIAAGGTGAENLGYTWDNLELNYEVDGVRQNPKFLAHFNDNGSFGHLGDAFYRIGASTLFYPAIGAVDDTSNITFDYNGKFYGAIDVNDGGASYQTYSHYDTAVNAATSTAFWWKPNFAKPTGSTSVSVRIWEWKSIYGTDRFYLDYKYNGTNGQEYLLFRAPTSATTSITTNTAPTVDAVDFNGYNFIAFRWVNFASSNDRIGVKLNDLNMTYKELTGDQLNNVDPNDRFVIKNGSFDEFVIRDESMDNTQAEADRLLGVEYQPDSIPADCEEAKKMYGQFSGDFNGNCVVNLEDFAVIADDWLDCYNPVDGGCLTPWDN